MGTLNVVCFCDGDEPEVLKNISREMSMHWEKNYKTEIIFKESINIKQLKNKKLLPEKLKKIEEIRNPDIYFFEENNKIELGGIEITTHSPDGSNIEKRYPFLYAAGLYKTNAFVATPYLKRRPGGQINRFPRRHAERNIGFLKRFKETEYSFLRCYYPTEELHGNDIQYLPEDIKSNIGSWKKISHFFADYLANVTNKQYNQVAREGLENFYSEMIALNKSFINKSDKISDPSTLIQLKEKWIQVYNSRPDSGHWERGEGQFDSIDGRLMFTIDGIDILKKENKPKSLEFWLPQICSQHPWVVEQKERDYKSKRFKNIIVTLENKCITKFSNNLSEDDWKTLDDNEMLLLERKDWELGIFKISDLIPSVKIKTIARAGLQSLPVHEIKNIEKFLRDKKNYYCSLRPYTKNLKDELNKLLKELPKEAIVYAPRIPKNKLTISSQTKCKLILAEECSKNVLKALRQIHRYLF